MKKCLLQAICLVALLTNLNGQANNNYIWLMGYPPNMPELNYGGTMLDFNENNVSPKFFNVYSTLAEPGILSNSSGQLKAYSNGCNMYNSIHTIIVDGDSLGYGPIWVGHCTAGYPGDQDKLFLYWPGDTSKAILFHMRTENGFINSDLLYSTVLFDKEFPYGKVDIKNQFLVEAKLSSNITACKHANGRDWWVILPEGKSNRFFIFLLSPNGVSLIHTISIGQSWGNINWGGQAVFSPDGTKYIRYNPWKGLDIFDFDRITGVISNVKESGPFSDPVNIGGGAAISNDSRYLYVSENLNLFQFDLKANNILNSKILIDTFDHFVNPFATTFYQMLLAPDGKIYMTSTNGVKSLHVITHPERKGLDCDFVQHAMQLPTYSFIGSVNMPYFRLGPLDGSIADTLGINNSPIADFRYEIDSSNPLEVHFRNLSYFSPETYSWTFGNNTNSSQEDPFPTTYNSKGEYKVCLTVANQYGSNTFCRTIILGDSITSTGVVMDTSEIRVSPNPFNSSISVSFSKDFGRVSFEMFSLMGQKVYKDEFLIEETKIFEPILPPGIYFYIIRSNGSVLKSGKIMKVE